VIRRMRDQARAAQKEGERIKSELDSEFDSLRASGCASNFDQGGDAYDPKLEPGIPRCEVAAECDEYEIGEVKDAQGL